MSCFGSIGNSFKTLVSFLSGSNLIFLVIWMKFQNFGLIMLCWFFSLQLFPESHCCQHTHRPIHRVHVAMSTGPLVWDALPCTVGIPRGVYHLTWCKRWTPCPSYFLSDIFFPLCLPHNISAWYTIGSFNLWGDFQELMSDSLTHGIFILICTVYDLVLQTSMCNVLIHLVFYQTKHCVPLICNFY